VCATGCAARGSKTTLGWHQPRHGARFGFWAPALKKPTAGSKLGGGIRTCIRFQAEFVQGFRPAQEIGRPKHRTQAERDFDLNFNNQNKPLSLLRLGRLNSTCAATRAGAIGSLTCIGEKSITAERVGMTKDKKRRPRDTRAPCVATGPVAGCVIWDLVRPKHVSLCTLHAPLKMVPHRESGAACTQNNQAL
jgi:hypothetical protein